MLSILKAIFDIPGTRETDSQFEALIEAAVEKAVDGTDPRLRLIDGYTRKMQRAVTEAVHYVDNVAAVFAPPLKLSRRAFATDPQVHALFGSADDLPRIMAESREVRDFLTTTDDRPTSPIYAGLRMSRTEKTVLAPEIQGNTLHADVVRTIVNFSDHALVIPAASETELLRDLKERIYIALVECALARLTSIKGHRAELEKQRSLLRMKLKTLRARGLGMEAFTDRPRAERDSVESIERRLLETEQELKETVASLATLNEYLDQINDVLSHPAEHVKLSPASTRLTRMGFKTTANASDPGDEIFYTEIEVGGSERFAGRLVEFLGHDSSAA